MKNKKGFTLTELMVVVMIIAGLAAVSYPAYTRSITKAKVSEAISLTEIVREAQIRNKLLHKNYFDKFDNKHVTGRTRLIKTNKATVSGGILYKDPYEVSISDAAGVNSGCINVLYKNGGDTVLQINTHVEDNLIWCKDYTGSELCGLISDLEPESTNDCIKE